MGGCLPMLVQIPVFIALYWVLAESVELRQAPFFGWIHSLSDKDPYFILPLLNGATMWITQKLTPSPGMDPMQAKMMQMMPVMFAVMFAFFPARTTLSLELTRIRLAPRRVRTVRFRDADGATIDHGLALLFRAPASFTGEDVVELHAHGSPVVLHALLARCVELGARPARPGE